MSTFLERLDDANRKSKQLANSLKSNEEKKSQLRIESILLQSIIAFDDLLSKYKDCRNKCGFEWDIKNNQQACQIYDDLRKLSKNIEIEDEGTLNNVTKKINEVNRNAIQDWNIFWDDKYSKIRKKLSSVSSLLDKEQVESINNQIDKGRDWNNLFDTASNGNTNFCNLIEAYNLSEQLIDNLNLKPEIRMFIDNVSKNKARISDLTDEILDWIRNNDLDSKFRITFLNK
ncbi:MAG: hypothetical protein LKE64_10560 [Solobacterium sp.]|jgi:hypothetical protein|nr:hypothetical protein [Solobacterium sp.]MCH4048335.1 hypothetical protein [Solobacterium sp.]MCH4074813.1 hypothetical protein [Solobacterium sp.]